MSIEEVAKRLEVNDEIKKLLPLARLFSIKGYSGRKERAELTRSRLMDMFNALLYLKEIAEDENENEIAECLQKVSEFVFVRSMYGQ